MCYVGTVLLNPNTQDSPSIMIRYKEYSDKPIVFPKLDAILELASKEMDSVRVLSIYHTHNYKVLTVQSVTMD